MAQLSLYDQGLTLFKERTQTRIHGAKEQQEFDIFLAAQKDPRDVYESCALLKNEAGSKYGDLKLGSKVKIDQKWIDGIFGNIQSFTKAGSIMTKYAPESVGMAWYAISLGLGAIQANYALYSLFGSGLTDMTDMMVIIAQYDRLYDERPKQDFTSSDLLVSLFAEIKESYVAMLDFAFTVQRHLSKGGWARLRHGVKDFFGTDALKFQGKLDTMARQKAMVLERTDSAFQDKTFKALDQAQEVLSAIRKDTSAIAESQKDMEQLFKASANMQKEFLQSLDDFKASVKPRTPWDMAMQNFTANKKALNPLEKMTGQLYAALDQKLEGTCEWINEHPVYKAWTSSGTDGMLCVFGREGTGKSILLASTFMSIDKDFGGPNSAVLYLSCSGELSDNRPRNLTSIGNSLIYQLYRLATVDNSKLALLEKCNDVFNKSKEGFLGRTKEPKAGRDPPKQQKAEEAAPDLSTTLTQLCSILDKQLFIVLDATDSLPEDEQESLYEALEMLTAAGKSNAERQHQARVLVSCRTGTRFHNSLSGGAKTIDVESDENFARKDIAFALDLELSWSTKWTEQQKLAAIHAICDSGRCMFGYAMHVAIPFLLEPFQGPLSGRLKSLPKGIDDVYTQALDSMAANYLELLRTALSFVLFSPGPVKVVEIMDAHNGIFTTAPDQEDTGELRSGSFFRLATKLELQQIRAVAGPFLNISADDPEAGAEAHFVSLKDPTQAKEYFLRPGEDCKSDQGRDNDALCNSCKAKLHSHSRLHFSEKECHLDLAILSIRHMCSPDFWKQSYQAGWPQPELISDDQVQASEELESQRSEGKLAEPAEEAKSEMLQTEVSTLEAPASAASEPTVQLPDTQTQDQPEPKSITSDVDDEGDNVSIADSDESMDAEDRGLSTFKNTSSPVETTFESSTNYDRFFRYETVYWWHHIQQAEALWPSNERYNKKWTELMNALDYFASQCAKEFAMCQVILFYIEDVDDHLGPPWKRGIWKPLHIAALLQLKSWASHLLNSGKSLTEVCHDRDVLQASARGKGTKEMLQLLLEKGADPNHETDHRMPVAHSWLWSRPTRECERS